MALSLPIGGPMGVRDSRIGRSGLIPALAVGAIVMALHLVPERIDARLPERYRIAEGTTFKVGAFRYVPERSWVEDRGRSVRGTKSVLTDGFVTFRVTDIGLARSPQDAYEKAVTQVRSLVEAPGLAISAGQPVIGRGGLPGLRGAASMPGGTGIVAAFAADFGGVAVWVAVPDDLSLAPQTKADVEAMIASLEHVQ